MHPFPDTDSYTELVTTIASAGGQQMNLRIARSRCAWGTALTFIFGFAIIFLAVFWEGWPKHLRVPNVIFAIPLGLLIAKMLTLSQQIMDLEYGLMDLLEKAKKIHTVQWIASDGIYNLYEEKKQEPSIISEQDVSAETMQQFVSYMRRQGNTILYNR